MSDFLKGNFKTKKNVEAPAEEAESLEKRFEKEALKKLGGSIAFVSKQKVHWGDDEETHRNDNGGLDDEIPTTVKITKDKKK
jgi:hypothetical protein